MNELDYPELRVRKRNSLLHTLNGLLMFLVFFAFIVLMIILFVPPIKKKREAEVRVEQLKAEVAKEKEILVRRKREEDLLRNDPQYLETIARDKLDLMKEGETIIRIESTPGPKPLEKNAH
jgi:cell division protein FtsB